jgi:class 3 adenylate cyclase
MAISGSLESGPAGAREALRQLRQRLKRAARSKRELERRVFHLKTLYDLSREIGFLIDTPAIMRNLLLMSIGTFGTFRGVILLVDVSQHRVEAALQRGLDDRCLAALTAAVEAKAFPDAAAGSGIRDLGRVPRSQAKKLPALLGLLASFQIRLWLPFQVKEHLWAGIGLGEKLSGDPYTAADRELLTTLGNQGAVALKNATTHQQVVRYAEELAASLRRIQLLESIKRNLAKFVPATVQRLIEESPEAPLLEKRETDVSVLFADITGYTSLSAHMALDEVNRLVERYFSAFLDEILACGGDVNETAGDGLMVTFRDDDPRRHARAAVSAALGIQRRTRELNVEVGPPFEPITMKVGVNSGIAAVGATKIEGVAGTRWTYTASGTTTNIAARLAALAESDGAVLVSAETRGRLGEEFDTEELGARTLKNVREPLPVYRVLGRRGT